MTNYMHASSKNKSLLMPLWKGNDLISGPVVHQHVGSAKKELVEILIPSWLSYLNIIK